MRVWFGRQKIHQRLYGNQAQAVEVKGLILKVLWSKVSKLVRDGCSADVVCNINHEHYDPRTIVTQILRQMQANQRTG